MELYTLQELPKELFERFVDESEGKNAFSKLATSQTGNDRTVPRSRLEYVLDSADHLMLVAVENNELIGTTIAQRVTGIANSYMYIHDVVVDPKARGMGLGTKLMEEIMKRGEQKWPEIVRMQLTSRPSRGTGPFFEKCGFRPRTEEAGDPTVVYVKDLKDYRS